MRSEQEITDKINELSDAIDNDAPYYETQAMIDALEWVLEWCDDL